MTTIIKIDRSTVKVNPRAGATTSHIMGDEIITFTTVCSEDEYERLKYDKGVFITWKSINLDPMTKIKGVLAKGYDFTNLPGKWDIEGNRNVETFNTLPEPKYLYKYEDISVPCSNCGFMVLHSEIDQECDDYTCYDVCPKCEKTDTFDYRYESIFIVAKELNL